MKFNYIYISVKTTEGYEEGYVHRTGLSGQYGYHSTKDNADIFVRPGAESEHLDGEDFYLIYRNGFWFITNEVYGFNELVGIDADFGAFLRIKTTGTPVWASNRLLVIVSFSHF